MFILMIILAIVLILILIYMIFDSKKYKFVKKNKQSKDLLFDVKLGLCEMILVSTVLGVIGFVVTWYFYKSILVSIISAAGFTYFIKMYKVEKKNRLKCQIIDEFINLNNLLLAELQTGISVTLAYENLAKNIEKSDILKFPKLEPEILMWINKLNMGEDISVIINEFSERSKDANLMQFANMLSIATKRGGDILSIIMNINSVLNDERQMLYDIEVLITEKKLEQRVLTVTPVFILIFLNYSAYDFISPLYTTVLGRITMSVLLIVFIISFLWAKKITVIK